MKNSFRRVLMALLVFACTVSLGSISAAAKTNPQDAKVLEIGDTVSASEYAAYLKSDRQLSNDLEKLAKTFRAAKFTYEFTSVSDESKLSLKNGKVTAIAATNEVVTANARVKVSTTVVTKLFGKTYTYETVWTTRNITVPFTVLPDEYTITYNLFKDNETTAFNTWDEVVARGEGFEMPDLTSKISFNYDKDVEVKAAGAEDAFDFATAVANKDMSINIYVKSLHSIRIQLYKNGDTSKAQEIWVPAQVKGSKIDEEAMKTALYNAIDKPEEYVIDYVFYHDGGWNQYKKGNTSATFDFEKRVVSGWTNLHTMIYHKENVRYFMSEEDRKAAKPVAYATGLKGTVFENTAKDPEKTGYTFQYWYKEGQPNTNYFTSNQKIGGWTNLVAKWKVNTYTIRLHDGFNPLTSDGRPQDYFKNEVTVDITYDTEYSLPTAGTKELFERPGFTFKGWANAPRKAATIVVDANGVYTSENSIFGLTDLYAVWEANDLTVKFDANGGKFADGSSQVDKATKFDQTPYATLIAGDLPTREGYVLVGWSTSADSTELYKGMNWNCKQSRTLYAVWEKLPELVEEAETPAALEEVTLVEAETPAATEETTVEEEKAEEEIKEVAEA